MADDMTDDVRVVQARAKMRSGRMRAFVADYLAAADGLDVWAELSTSLDAKRKAHAEALAEWHAREASARTATESAEAEQDRRVSAAEARTTQAEATAQSAEARLATVTAALVEEEKKLADVQALRQQLQAVR